MSWSPGLQVVEEALNQPCCAGYSCTFMAVNMCYTPSSLSVEELRDAFSDADLDKMQSSRLSTHICGSGGLGLQTIRTRLL